MPESDSSVDPDCEEEDDDREIERNWLIILIHQTSKSSKQGLLSMTAGCVLMWLTVKCLVWINLSASTNEWLQVFYLLLERPLFVAGASLVLWPCLMSSPFVRPVSEFMASSFWYPLARLTYGAYLSHGIFMLFKTYNSETGTFACEFDAFLLFFAYVTFAFLFSFFCTVLIEIPCLRLADTFLIGSRFQFAQTFMSFHGL